MTSRQRATAQARHFAEFGNALSAWSPDADVPSLCSYITQDRELIPPLVLRHDFALVRLRCSESLLPLTELLQGWMKRTIFSVSLVWASVIANSLNVMVQVPFSHLQPGLDSVPDIVKICIERCITVLEGGQWDAAEVSKFATVGTFVSIAFEVTHDGISGPETVHSSLRGCHRWCRTNG